MGLWNQVESNEDARGRTKAYLYLSWLLPCVLLAAERKLFI